MAKIFDIALDSEFDLLIEGGDIQADYPAITIYTADQDCFVLAGRVKG